MHPHPDLHLVVGKLECRPARAWHLAGGQGDAHAPRSRVGVRSNALDLRHRPAHLGGGAGALEHDDVAGDTASLRLLALRRRGDVVRHAHLAHLDVRGRSELRRQAEVHHVTGVVAVGHQHAVPMVGRPDRGQDHVRRWGGEDVAACRRVGHPDTDVAAERRLVS